MNSLLSMASEEIDEEINKQKGCLYKGYVYQNADNGEICFLNNYCCNYRIFFKKYWKLCHVN